jgi:hypothetical protein
MTNSPQDAATPAEADPVDAPPLHDPFRQCRPGLVADFSREDRVRLLGDFADAVMRGEAPRKEVAMFVASGLAAWLDRGGSLTRDYFRVCGVQGCTLTPSILWRRMRDGAGTSSKREQDGAVPATVETHN